MIPILPHLEWENPRRVIRISQIIETTHYKKEGWGLAYDSEGNPIIEYKSLYFDIFYDYFDTEGNRVYKRIEECSENNDIKISNLIQKLNEKRMSLIEEIKGF